MIQINEEDAKTIEKFKEILNKGYYCNSNQVTSLYNRILEKNVTNTNCSSCLRKRVQELNDALKRQREKEKKEQEKLVITNEQTSETEGVITITEEPSDATEQGTPKTKPRGKGSRKK